MRKRTFTYHDGTSETDYVCERCETIVLDPPAGCQHCRETAQKAASRIAKLKGQQQVIEMSEPGELLLF
ncbi:MAG: hypothetical protein D4R44_06910 [Actinobacteria bacterium]|nr:MAG: hypothetical protein D4R44_06910 [Actinomycetota bacterium]